MLTRFQGRIRHRRLEKISPLAVPVLLEIGKESVMGASVAEDLAAHGLQAVVVDTTQEALRHAETNIRRSVRAAKLFDKSGNMDPPDEILSRIALSTELSDLANAAFVIENATEDISVKQAIYQDLNNVCADDCIFVANTSCIPIARLGSFAQRPDRTIGVHFMNPVPMKDTVEMIPSEQTSPGTVSAVTSLLDRLGKEYILVKDSPGFVSNRVLMVTINEAIRLVEEGVADADSVDRIFQSCFGHPMGPLATGDLIGLDTILLSLEVLLDSFGEEKYRPCDLLREMVETKRYGRKTGEGFFKYG